MCGPKIAWQAVLDVPSTRGTGPSVDKAPNETQ